MPMPTRKPPRRKPGRPRKAAAKPKAKKSSWLMKRSQLPSLAQLRGLPLDAENPAPVKRGPGRPRKDGSPAQPRKPVPAQPVRRKRTRLPAPRLVGPPTAEPVLRLQIQGLRQQLDATKTALESADAALETICGSLVGWLEQQPQLEDIVAVTIQAHRERERIPPKLRAPKPKKGK